MSERTRPNASDRTRANTSERTRPNIIPTLRYRDSAAAVEWLCDAFGFERHLVVPGDDGSVHHAQLRCGPGLVMLGPATDDDYSRVQKPPTELAGLNSQSPYIIVPDPDAHYDRAKGAGAKIVFDLADQDYGGRGYSCLDLEGNLWHFGNYDPFADA